MKEFLPLADSRVALAVSGGPDSMALAFLMQRYCAANHLPAPLAFIVDHALRDESATEADTVKIRLQALGLNAEILRWQHEPVTTRLHSEARKARYDLLLAVCRKASIACLFMAHQQEDQAETILMRLAKGTGIDGLAGISSNSVVGNVRLIRPLLALAKERLIATCEAHHIEFVTDPSNAKDTFARGRLRRVMPLLADEGLTVERLVDFGARAGEARDALQYYTESFLRDASSQDETGAIHLDKNKLLKLPRAIALRALSETLQYVYEESYAPQRASLALLLDALHSDENFAPRTLNGCLLSTSKQQIVIAREFSAITETRTIKAGESAAWDGRWRITLMPDIGDETYLIKTLGNPPHDLLDRLAPDLRHKIPQGRRRATLPALWLGDAPVLIPFFHKKDQVAAELLRKWPLPQT